MNGVISDEDFGIYKDRLEKELRELEEKIEGQKDGEKSLADQYRRLQQIRDTIENKNYNEQAILEILYGCVEVIEIHNNGDMDVTMSKELMRSKFELYSMWNRITVYSTFPSPTKKKPSMTATGKPTTRKYWN